MGKGSSVMSEVKTHKDLKVWKEAMALAKGIYELTKDFPREETYGLVSQIRRAAVSIPSNLTEGAARNSNKERYYPLDNRKQVCYSTIEVRHE